MRLRQAGRAGPSGLPADKVMAICGFMHDEWSPLSPRDSSPRSEWRHPVVAEDEERFADVARHLGADVEGAGPQTCVMD